MGNTCPLGFLLLKEQKYSGSSRSVPGTLIDTEILSSNRELLVVFSSRNGHSDSCRGHKKLHLGKLAVSAETAILRPTEATGQAHKVSAGLRKANQNLAQVAFRGFRQIPSICVQNLQILKYLGPKSAIIKYYKPTYILKQCSKKLLA